MKMQLTLTPYFDLVAITDQAIHSAYDAMMDIMAQFDFGPTYEELSDRGEAHLCWDIPIPAVTKAIIPDDIERRMSAILDIIDDQVYWDRDICEEALLTSTNQG